MTGTNGSEDWRLLCEMASKEMDSDKLMELVAKINYALDECNQRSPKHGGQIRIATVFPPRTSATADENPSSVAPQLSPRVEYHC